MDEDLNEIVPMTFRGTLRLRKLINLVAAINGVTRDELMTQAFYQMYQQDIETAVGILRQKGELPNDDEGDNVPLHSDLVATPLTA